MRLSFLEKLQECNNGYKKKVKLVKIIIRYKGAKSNINTLPNGGLTLASFIL